MTGFEALRHTIRTAAIAFWGWAAGKKTYLLAGALLATGLALLMTGRLTPATASALILFAAAGFPVTFRAALEQHQQQTLEVLELIARTGAALGTRNYGLARVAAADAVTQAVQLGDEIHAETAAADTAAQEASSK